MTADDAHPSEITARQGFFPLVTGDKVDLTQAGSLAVMVSGSASFRQAGANFCFVGGNVESTQSGSNMTIAAGNVSMHQSGSGVVAALEVEVQEGFIGAVFARDVKLENSRVLLTPPQAAAFGAGLGLVLLALGRLFRRG
jgi:hypothetical protein